MIKTSVTILLLSIFLAAANLAKQIPINEGEHLTIRFLATVGHTDIKAHTDWRDSFPTPFRCAQVSLYAYKETYGIQNFKGGNKQTRGPQSASELYRLNDRHL
jgi:hypothetical protein